MPSRDPFGDLPVPLDLEPMEARLVEDLPEDEGWQFEPKWDGFRCLAFKSDGAVDLRAKSGKPLARYFPEMVAILKKLPQKRFVIDGELAIADGDTLSFEALQARLHPAESRIAKLSKDTPAILILFDMIVTPRGRSLMGAPLTERRKALEAFATVAREPALKLSPYTDDRAEAEAWLSRASGALDGVIAKRSDGPYVAGERAMLKVKPIRTADCVVGGFRYGSKSREVGSLLLGLYDEAGLLDHVGFTATITDRERAAFTKLLEGLIAPPGFTGKAPGGPSRWSTERSGDWQPVQPKLVVEVRYDQVTGNRFRHGTKLVRFRPDKAPKQCTFEQIAPIGPAPKLIAKLLGA